METQLTLADQVGIVLILLLLAGSIMTWLLVWRRVSERGSAIDYQPRRHVPWRMIDVLVIAAFYISAMSLATAAALQVAGIEPSEVDGDVLLRTPGIFLALSLAGLATSAFVLVWLRLVRSATADDLGWSRDRVGEDVSLGVLGLLFAVVPVYGIQVSLFQFFPTPHKIIESLEAEGGLTAFAMATLVAVVAAPIVEELVFRLVLQGWLESCEPRWRHRVSVLRSWPRGRLSILISSAIFALVHIGDGPAPVALFFLALVLGYQYQRTHRILPSIVTHAAFNGTSMLMLALQQASGA